MYYFHLFTAQEDIEQLVLTERIETLVPLSYIAIMVMAYYGPNANILGSVKLAIWHHQSTIQDINQFISNVGLLFGVDLMSFIINGIILWVFCKVNVMKVLQKLQKQYWFIYTFAEAYLLTEVNKTEKSSHNFQTHGINFQVIPQLSIGGGHDLTLQFDWIDRRYQANSTSCN